MVFIVIGDEKFKIGEKKKVAEKEKLLFVFLEKEKEKSRWEENRCCEERPREHK